jgi:hypothetical protein
LIDTSSGALYLCCLASHSLSLGHFFFARLSIQSPQIVISGLHGVKPSVLPEVAALSAFALRAFAMLDIFDMITDKVQAPYPKEHINSTVLRSKQPNAVWILIMGHNLGMALVI